MRSLAAVVALLVACGGSTEPTQREPAPPTAPTVAEASVPASRGGTDRVGLPAPQWEEVQWLDGEPRELSDLRGRVVLIRFWTETCPFCQASAPALKLLDETHRDRGLTVVGLHHPKPRGSTRTVEEIKQVTDAWGWSFPVGLDESWAAIDRYWLAGTDRDYTSVSFLVDRQGVIRFVHPGPELHPAGPPDHERCRQDFRDMERAIETLLAER